MKFWSKIDILVKNRNFGPKSKSWSNVDIFCQKSIFLVKNRALCLTCPFFLGEILRYPAEIDVYDLIDQKKNFVNFFFLFFSYFFPVPSIILAWSIKIFQKKNIFFSYLAPEIAKIRIFCNRRRQEGNAGNSNKSKKQNTTEKRWKVSVSSNPEIILIRSEVNEVNKK